MEIVKKFSKNGATIILLYVKTKANKESTELSKHIWELSETSIQHKSSFDIASRASPDNGCTRKCDLFLIEKLKIAKAEISLPYLTPIMSSSLNGDMNKFTLKSCCHSEAM